MLLDRQEFGAYTKMAISGKVNSGTYSRLYKRFVLRSRPVPQGRLPLLGEDLLFLLTEDSRLLPLPPVVRFSNLPINKSWGLTYLGAVGLVGALLYII